MYSYDNNIDKTSYIQFIQNWSMNPLTYHCEKRKTPWKIRKEFNHKHSRTFFPVLYGDLSSRQQSWANPKDEKTKWNSSLWSCKWKWIRYFQTSSCQRQKKSLKSMWESPLCLKAIAEYHRFFQNSFHGVFIVMTQTMESGPPSSNSNSKNWLLSETKTRYEMVFSIFFRRMSLEELRNRHTDPSSHPRCVSCFWKSHAFPMLPSKKNRIFVFIDPTIWNSLFMHRFCRLVHHFIHYGCISYQLPLLPTIPHPPPDVRRPLKALATSALAAWTTSCIGLVSPHRNGSS